MTGIRLVGLLTELHGLADTHAPSADEMRRVQSIVKELRHDDHLAAIAIDDVWNQVPAGLRENMLLGLVLTLDFAADR